MIDLIESMDRMLPSVQLVQPYVQTMPLEIATEQIFWLVEDVSIFIVKYLAHGFNGVHTKSNAI